MLYFIPTPIGNLDDISMRSLKLLESAQIVFCEDTRVTKKLFALLSQKYNISPDIEKYISLHSHNEKEVLQSLNKDIFDKTVIYVTDAGMPCISDPGCELVKYCRDNEIVYEVIPGANALLLAYTASGFCDTKFLFFGFLPHKGNERRLALNEALYSGYTVILYESPHRLQKLLDQIFQIEPAREMFLIKEATKLYEKKFYGIAVELKEKLKDENIKGEWVVVIKGAAKHSSKITLEDIKNLDLPKKQMAKLISKITGESVKSCYNNLL